MGPSSLVEVLLPVTCTIHVVRISGEATLWATNRGTRDFLLIFVPRGYHLVAGRGGIDPPCDNGLIRSGVSQYEFVRRQMRRGKCVV